MRPARIRLFVVLALLVALAMAAGTFAWNAGRWLRTPDEPAPADAIVVLAGSYFRHIEAAALYRRGLAPQVLVSAPVADPATEALAAVGVRLVPQVEIQERILQSMGVPAGAVRRLGEANVSTAEEAAAAARMLPGQGVRLLVVTSPSHVRRSRMIFRDAFEGRGASIRVVAASREAFPDRWWTNQTAARDVLLEWTKILFYLAGGRFRGAGTGGA